MEDDIKKVCGGTEAMMTKSTACFTLLLAILTTILVTNWHV